MVNRYRAKVSSPNHGATLGKFIRLAFPLFSDLSLQEAFRNRDVKVNGLRVQRNAVVYTDDAIEIFTKHAMLDIPRVYEDQNIVIINKPAGISAQSDNPDEYTVQKWAEETYLPAINAQICHRLDNQTSGLMIISLNEDSHENILAMFRSRQIIKEYTCLCVGTPNPEDGIQTAYLTKDADKGKVYIDKTPGKNSLKIITEYHILQKGEISRLRVVLHTGRTHQIRAHLSYLGAPVLGDDVYGSRSANKECNAKRLCLCATGLAFSGEHDLPYLNEMTFSINPPF